MEKETSEFNTWLAAIKNLTKGLELIDKLDAIALIANKDLRVRLWFVEILGRRW